MINKGGIGKFICKLIGHKPSNWSKDYLWNHIQSECSRCGKHIIKMDNGKWV